MAEVEVTLAQVRATQQQRHGALMACLAFAAVTAAAAPFASTVLPTIPAFLPAYQVTTAFCYGVVAWLLFGDYRQDGAPSTLILAAGSVWTALILLAQLLSIPGMVGPQRAIGGDQTTIHLWMWWHIGPPLFALLFAGTLRLLPGRLADPDRRRLASTLTLAGAAFSFFAVLALVTRYHDALPVLSHGPDISAIVSSGVGPFVTALSAVAACAVWRATRGATVLELWLVVSLVALVFDNLITMDGGRRESVGWYVGRLEALASAATLLVVYLRHVHAMVRQAAASAAALQVELGARLRAESALAEGQKLEDLGQLTGGVAHDFGNILQLLRNELELIKLHTREEGVRERVDAAHRAMARGQKLIKQLLTFAKRQPLQFEPVDVNMRLVEIAEVARASMGRARIELDLADDLWSVVTDANELDSAILNLVMNARDAMPVGGVLTISTCNAGAPNGADHPAADHAGDFVRVAFRDEGTGMTADVVARAWEPFFTTKPAGKGTGLGLATVYGFVRQSGGTATLDSLPGRGTEVAIYLPKGAPSVLHDASRDAERRESNVLPLFRRDSSG